MTTYPGTALTGAIGTEVVKVLEPRNQVTSPHDEQRHLRGDRLDPGHASEGITMKVLITIAFETKNGYADAMTMKCEMIHATTGLAETLLREIIIREDQG